MAYEESFSRLSHLLDDRLKSRLRELAYRPDSSVGFALGRAGIGADELVAGLDGKTMPNAGFAESSDGGRNAFIEAIVLRVGRPSFLITNGQVDWTTGEVFEDDASMARMKARVGPIQPRFLAVGRVNTINHPRTDWLGTSWLIEGPNGPIVITNRHVAEEFAMLRPGGRVAFRTDVGSMLPLGAMIDFRREFGTSDIQEVGVRRIRYLARPGDPDIAILELEPNDHLATPLVLADREAPLGALIGTVGYPARDSRNDSDAQNDIFGTVYDVKRFAPGRVTQATGPGRMLCHDAPTLGGASGSPLLDLENGCVVGLHFRGEYLKRNVAVSVESIKAALAGRSVGANGGDESVAEGRQDGTSPASHFSGRTGYDAAFLSIDGADFDVPLPAVPAEGLAPLLEQRGEYELRYTHFSVLFDAARRSPRLAAVNIDGSKPVKIKRGNDKWNKDLRIDPSVQLSSKEFPGDFDRGHMVRREDPNWGTPTVAAIADADTFHYTNAALQHALLNRNKARWLGLEDYVLRSAQTHGFRASVFTGPILDDADPELTEAPFVQVPRAFWKVVVMVAADTQRLHATGYVLGQSNFIQSLTESFEYGDYNLYQVPIAKIAGATGIDFGDLARFDPMAVHARQEAVFGGVTLISSLDEIRL